MFKQLIKLICLLAFGTAIFMIATAGQANPSKPAKADPVVVKGKKPVEKKAAPEPKKKDDGKIKPLDPNRKVPTLKKKYRKDEK